MPLEALKRISYTMGEVGLLHDLKMYMREQVQAIPVDTAVGVHIRDALTIKLDMFAQILDQGVIEK